MSASRDAYARAMAQAGHQFYPDPPPHPQWDDPSYVESVRRTLYRLAAVESLHGQLKEIETIEELCAPHRHPAWRTAAALVISAASKLTDAELGGAAELVRELCPGSAGAHKTTEPPPQQQAPAPAESPEDEAARLRARLAELEGSTTQPENLHALRNLEPPPEG